MTKKYTINWLFGRGLSIECNLFWTVPKEWKCPHPCQSREIKISMIKNALAKEMNKLSTGCEIIRYFFEVLSIYTNSNYNNRLITTNWDYLLDREIQNLDLEKLPSWLDDSLVFHLNGTIENFENHSNRSPFLLEEDSGEQRTFSVEANTAYNKMIWNKVFVVVGMSFECETDRFFLNALNKVEDNLIIGESLWVVVNPDADALKQTCLRIQIALPCASVIPIEKEFNKFLQGDIQKLFLTLNSKNIMNELNIKQLYNSMMNK